MWFSSLRVRAGYIQTTRYPADDIAEHHIAPWPRPGAGWKKKPRGGRRRGRRRVSQVKADAARRIEIRRLVELIVDRRDDS